MSEMKRVSFTTLSSSTSSTTNFSAGASVTVGVSGGINSGALTTSSSRFGADFLSGQQNSDRVGPTGASADRKSNKTMRLTIELFPTDSCQYPEFNYSRLLHLEKKKQKKLKQKANGFTDPFNDNDNDVARIAHELEKKYGSAYGSGRGRSKKDDLCDIGLGYDESDSFIDNTEAYDEIIPEEMETIEGGFYINCGPLEFQKLHTESTTTKTDEIIKMPNRPRKRVISSSSSDSSSSSEEDADENVESEGEISSADTVKGNKNGSATTQLVEKRPRSNSITNPSKKPKNSQEGNAKKGKSVKNAGIGSSSTSNSPKPSSVGSDSDKERVRQKIVKTTTIKDMLKAKRDNFLKMQEGGSGSGPSGNSEAINGELKGTASKSSEEDDSSSSGESDESSDDSDSNDTEPDEKKTKSSNGESTEKLRTGDTKLPDIEAEIIADVQQFKEIIKMKNMIGKRFQFDDTLVEAFLKIDEALLCVEKAHRNMVFAHLEYHLVLPKYFFLRKAKQLRIKEEKMKSKRALGKLRKAIIEAMPSVIANFEADIRKHAELAVNINAEYPPKMPKKKFPWNNNLRNLLYDVYQVRWTSFPVLGTRKETLEDFINVFLRDKVVELWPKDWMRFEELQREIEKRKSAAKKAKDKKKEKENGCNSNPANATPGSNNAVSGSSAAITQTITCNNAYMKQFEEFATGSRSSYANSDTESVASSGASNSLKRKAGVKGTNKTSKLQAQSNMPGTNTTLDNNKKPPTFVPASTNLEFNMQNVLTSNAVITSSQVSTSALPPLLTTTIVSTSAPLPSQSKHSRSGETNVQVIDLDNYRSPSDILLTSQQMLRPGSSNAPITVIPNTKTALALSAPNRRESSSESDGVEIVSIYPATVKAPVGAPPKQKYKKNASSNFAMDTVNVNAFQSGPSTITNNNNNTNANNNNSQNIKSKRMELLSGIPSYDNKQVVRTFKDLDLSQQKTTNLPSPQNGSKKEYCAQ
ncbi:yemanuclein isoform X1 [Anastrepha obliqua]|uniref:yemanuclein isoform X1 n=1 Tax=Anastrepha obliqua TaxID=95512 RepID=UPI00240A8FBF|nr:yemanuclein isoform X1 [Anastrepha obliqua]XP_054725650.1 yemanuclein isoform X1 [Anastrepha obliqua]XP_054725651.1 yemanuclein isoform X1 [Anastrepha obliqua]XP_054725652.1 yemanuclein isoform X1 [Anastrepha obliqua]